MKRMPPQQKLNSQLRRERDSISLARLAAVLVCGLILTVGFIRAAAQNTIAVRHGYESEMLRRERARLLDEQNRLLAERDTASSPSRLEAAARRIGLEQARAAQVAGAEHRTLAHEETRAGAPLSIAESRRDSRRLAAVGDDAGDRRR